MFRKFSKNFVTCTLNKCYRPECTNNRTIWHSICNYKSFSKEKINFNIIRDKKLDNYFKKIEIELNRFPTGYTNQLPNSQLLRLCSERRNLINNLNALDDGQHGLTLDCTESSKEWLNLVKQEKEKLEQDLEIITDKLIDGLVSSDCDTDSIILEVKSGIGGKEAMLFTKTLFDMYVKYVRYKNWDPFIVHQDKSELGGLRHGTIQVDGHQVLKYLRYESGVHRVQRVPLTEKSGRLHTSTVTVAVLPHPTEYECSIDEKDIKVETFRSSGAGGQHVNKTESAIRIIHTPSNIVVECQEDRSQIKNRQSAMQKLRNKLYEHHMRLQEDELRNSRRFQVGTSARSDKVRTYNFTQDRVTDHRLGESFYNIETLLEGNSHLDEIIKN
uniref:Putative mitochondrial polypeptide chain release factor rhodnius neglectus n=1 Tax=Rhodnius prolixus TaxID=13249 RepID=A0A4P6D8G1_RHOPR